VNVLGSALEFGKYREVVAGVGCVWVINLK
jgi:hypothetical protein